MKKYGKLLLIVAAIIFGIGTFYMQSALSAGKYPDFKLVQQSGDEAEVEPVVIEGVYSLGLINPINERLKVTAEGSHYFSEASYGKKINGDYQPFLIKQLQQEHRHFMRGKTHEPSAFFEDENTLAYGDVTYEMGTLGTGPRDFRFDISVLDKKENEANSFNLDVPNSNNLSEIYVVEVQMINGELKVITMNNLAGEKNDSELHVYRFDPIDQKLIDDQAVLTIPKQSEEHYGEMSVLRRTSHNLKKNNIVINKKMMKDKQVEEGYETEEISSDLLLFNLETNEKEEIEVPKEISEDAHPTFYDGENVYFTWSAKGDFKAATYSIENKTVENKITVKRAHSNSEDADERFIFTVKDKKLYIVEKQSGQYMPLMQVVDLHAGDLLYKGEITVSDPSAEEEDYTLYLNHIEVR